MKKSIEEKFGAVGKTKTMGGLVWEINALTVSC
jgi:hypothetical protein